jgi:hypothetical protein
VKQEVEPEVEAAPEPEAAEEPQAETPRTTTGVVDETIWPELLAALKTKYNTLYGVVRMAQPDFSKAGELELGFGFAFHQKRINDSKNRQIIANIIKDISGESVIITCVLNKDAKPLKVSVEAAKPASQSSSGNLSTISNIFGGAELLES